MSNATAKKSILHLTLERTGGWYLVIAALITQIIASAGAIAANYTIQINAEFHREVLRGIVQFTSYTVLVTTLFVILFVFFRYRDTRKKLDAWKKNEGNFRDEAGWKEITSLARHYTILVVVAGILGEVIPILVYITNIPNITGDQIVYAALGLFASVIGTAAVALQLIDYLLQPARTALLPERIEDQLAGERGINLALKLSLTVFALLLTSILLLAPIGYHQTSRALQSGSADVLRVMQTQSLVVAFLIIIYGMSFAVSFSRSISTPIDALLENFKNIEAGDLSERATIKTSDEIGRLSIYFNQMISRLHELQSSLENQIAKRTDQLRATSEVGRAASSILDPDELVEKTVNLITEQLGYYYAAIFIVSPDGAWAELRSATGEAGAELKARQHRLAIGGKSMVGSAISLRQARIAHDVGLEAVRFNNPLLPNTRSEIALPLMVGGRVVGALDAQSTEPNAFDSENTETLLGMANQVAVALENARLYQEAQNALREIRANQRTQLSNAWSEISDSGDKLEFSVGQESYQVDNQSARLTVPLALRDQVIGEVSVLGDDAWTEDDISWVTAVARQAAFAIENARLLEESQQSALQERIISEITSKIWSSTTIEGIMQVAITELGRTLSANEAVIKLNLEE